VSSRELSSFYPRRAGWRKPFQRYVPGLRRLLHLEDFESRYGTTAFLFYTGLIVPGFTFWVRGFRRIGACMLAAYVVAVAVLVVWLGHTISNLAFASIISLHVSSIVFTCNQALRDVRLPNRLAFALVVLMVVSLGVYRPLLGAMETTWAVPLRVKDEVVVVNTRVEPATVKRGDFVLVRIEGTASHTVWIHSGPVAGPVLGVPGDVVEFEPGMFSVNGRSYPRRVYMPTAGRIVVPEKRWLIWPDFATVVQHGVDKATIAAAILDVAVVPQSQLIGKPFERWFWRPQVTQ
jgi:hypothetical protein